MMVSWFLAALLAYELARGPGRQVTRRVDRRASGSPPRSASSTRGGATGLIAARFLPLIPFNATCYAAGITGVARPRYAWTTLVGIAPFCAVVTFLGSRLQTLSLSRLAPAGRSSPRCWRCCSSRTGSCPAPAT